MKKLIALSGIATVALIVFLLGCGEKKKALYVYTWADYIDPELIAKFESENNCKVVVDTFDSNETMYAKLMAGASGYDIIMPTEYVMPLLVEANLIDKLDLSRFPNVKTNFDIKFKSEWALNWDIPYAFSCTGILWRKDKVPADLTFQDWNDMFDERLRGRICMMNDIREVLGLGLKMKGYSVNSTNAAEIAEATTVARFWKSRCSKMDNESYRTGIPSGEFYAAMAYNSDAIQLIADGRDDQLGYLVPTNGTTSSIDVFCIMKNSQSKDLACKFIDMFYDLTNAVKNAEYNGVPMPIRGLYDALSDDYKKIPMMKVSDELRLKCEDIKDVGNSLELYTKAWDKVKSNR